VINFDLNECVAKYPLLRSIKVRAAFLIANFFLIILALNQLKAASRSIFIDAHGADLLPYVWIATAIVMGAFVTIYHRLVSRYSRFNIVLGSCLLFSSLLVAFRLLMMEFESLVSVGLYIFVDILGVVLVEQFWSLTNSIYTTQEGQSWYGFVGTGGLVGGVAGGTAAALLVTQTPLRTPDLILTAAATIALIYVLSWLMGRIGFFCEVDDVVSREGIEQTDGWRAIAQSRYLILIAAILLLAQLVSPLVDFQYLKMIETAYPQQELRTAFLSMFLSLTGLISIAINLAVTPLIHRFWGPIAGLLVQPLLILISSIGFMTHSTLFFGAAAKISDRSLSYSINRASRELLYIPVSSVLIYQAKAWIDMLGYRIFKVAGSLLILIFTQWLPVKTSIGQLSYLSVIICGFWIGFVMLLRQHYLELCQQSV